MGRFETLAYVKSDDDPEDPAPDTLFLVDRSRTIIAYNESPDIPFNAGINPYRGCEHGCVYCYARPFHEFLGFSAGLDFESRILVKQEAPDLLAEELASQRWQPQLLGISGVTDAYQPIERRLKLTRRCLEVLADFRNPVAIVTKNALVTRDLDILGELHRFGAASVYVSVTTLDAELASRLEPRASSPRRRLAAIAELARAGIPTGVLVGPVIPGLTDHELPQIIAAAAAHGAHHARYTLLRLPHGVGALFERWLEDHYPQRKARVLARVRECRGGKLNQSAFGRRMRGEGVLAGTLRDLFALACRSARISSRGPELSSASFRRRGWQQLNLFDE